MTQNYISSWKNKFYNSQQNTTKSRQNNINPRYNKTNYNSPQNKSGIKNKEVQFTGLRRKAAEYNEREVMPRLFV